ncbi:hypothetical protein [Primorskyibacter sp. S87]|uniref:hypothetical protein n=1 Tax=Primorskyibacter sp. S87 TaxID=3415126 RepID=UPI003C7AEBE8
MLGFFKNMFEAIWASQSLKIQNDEVTRLDTALHLGDEPIISKADSMPWERDENEALY